MSQNVLWCLEYPHQHLMYLRSFWFGATTGEISRTSHLYSTLPSLVKNKPALPLENEYFLVLSTITTYEQGRSEVRWRPGQEASVAPPCVNLSSFGSKCTMLKKVLVTLLGLFGARGVVPPSLRPYLKSFHFDHCSSHSICNLQELPFPFYLQS